MAKPKLTAKRLQIAVGLANQHPTATLQEFYNYWYDKTVRTANDYRERSVQLLIYEKAINLRKEVVHGTNAKI